MLTLIGHEVDGLQNKYLTKRLHIIIKTCTTSHSPQVYRHKGKNRKDLRTMEKYWRKANICRNSAFTRVFKKLPRYSSPITVGSAPIGV